MRNQDGHNDIEAFELRRQLARLRAHLFASQHRQSAPRPACAPLWDADVTALRGNIAPARKPMEARAGCCATSSAEENGATMQASVVLDGQCRQQPPLRSFSRCTQRDPRSSD
jgi:hypothetical protein